MKFIVKETHGNTVSEWSVQDYLEEINRDRSNEWTDYTLEDILTSKDSLKSLFEEARYYELLSVINSKTNQDA
jgi:hypothetical protein